MPFAAVSYRFTLIIVALLAIASVLASVWLLLYGGLPLLSGWLLDSQALAQQHRLAIIGGFTLFSLLSQSIIVPSGSLMLILAGFALGALPAAAIYAAAQLIMAWPVYAVARTALRRNPVIAANPLDKLKPSRTAALTQHLKTLRGDGLLASMLLRLTPVIPSAGACVLAALFGIRGSVFLLGTLLCCWIRPLFFASSGSTLSAAVIHSQPQQLLSAVDVTPLLLLFLAALLMLLLRPWLSSRGSR